MKLSAATLMAAETRAFMAQESADLEWIEWCRLAVSRGVRFDLDPGTLREVPRVVQVAPGVVVLAGEGARSRGLPGASGER